MESRTLTDLVVAITDRVISLLEDGSETRLAIGQRQRHQIEAVEVQQVKDEVDEVGAAPPFRGILDQRERRDSVRPHSAELAVDIGLLRRQRGQSRNDRRIFAGRVKPGARQQTDIAAIEPGMHAIAVEFELWAHPSPLGASVTSRVSCGLTQAGNTGSADRDDLAIYA